MRRCNRCNSRCTVLSVSRRGNRLVLTLRRGVIDDDIGLSANICLEIAQQTRHLSRGHGDQLPTIGEIIERDQRFANEIEAPSDVAVPQAPANPIDDSNEIRARLAISCRFIA
jgi:hypothetical protein